MKRLKISDYCCVPRHRRFIKLDLVRWRTEKRNGEKIRNEKIKPEDRRTKTRRFMKHLLLVMLWKQDVDFTFFINAGIVEFHIVFPISFCFRILVHRTFVIFCCCCLLNCRIVYVFAIEKGNMFKSQ